MPRTSPASICRLSTQANRAGFTLVEVVVAVAVAALLGILAASTAAALLTQGQVALRRQEAALKLIELQVLSLDGADGAAPPWAGWNLVRTEPEPGPGETAAPRWVRWVLSPADRPSLVFRTAFSKPDAED